MEEWGTREDGEVNGGSTNWRSVKKKFASTVEKIAGKKNNAGENFLYDPTELPIVTVGPVIGKVTERSARILIELDKPGRVIMILVEQAEDARPSLDTAGALSSESKTNGTGQTRQVEKILEARRPSIFVFQNLPPGTTYRIRLRGCELRQPSSFRTFPAEISDSINFAVISCNKIFITEKEIPSHSDLWAHLAKAVEQGKIDMCLHVGDQIYGDGDKMLDAEAGPLPGDWSDCFRKSKALLEDLSMEQWGEHYETICESYREVYRKTWAHSYTAFCLANSPNLMIYDDHEVRDNWADLPDDWDTATVDFFIARCAWRVNLEYQRQLHEDVNFNHLELIDKDCHFHLISGVGIMFLDIRGSRTFHRVADDPHRYLGSKQWQDIETALDGGIFNSARVLLVCTPAPLVFLQSNFTDAFANRVPRLEDFKGHWSAAPHIEEQKKMIDVLSQWKRVRTSGDRDVLVLGGDVHCGGHSKIRIDRRLVFRQLTTSAIANHPLPKSAYYTLRFAESLGGVGQNITFKHHDWTRARNYGLVYIRNHSPQSASGPEITSQLIKGKYMAGITEGVKVSNLGESSSGWGGCFGCT